MVSLKNTLLHLLGFTSINSATKLFSTVIFIQEVMSNFLEVLQVSAMGTSFLRRCFRQRVTRMLSFYLKRADLKRAKSEC